MAFAICKLYLLVLERLFCSMRFFAKPGVYEPCGMYSVYHFLFLLLAACIIGFGLWYFRRADEKKIHRFTTVITALAWVAEIVKIVFNVWIVGVRSYNEYIPLYFCSMILYAGACASFGRGRLKAAGESFLATGGIVGGAVFLVMPTTTLTMYAPDHFLVWHSILLHTAMVLIGLIYLARGYYVPKWKNLAYYFVFVSIVCFTAILFNEITGANLMFVSRDFPGTPITILYNLVPRWLFTVIMWVGQATVPYLAVTGVYTLVVKGLQKRKKQ